MKIIISEQQLGLIVTENENITNRQRLIPLENQINELIDKKGKNDTIGEIEKNILDRFDVSLTMSGKNGVDIKIGQINLPIENQNNGLYFTKILDKNPLIIGEQPFSVILPDVSKLSEFKILSKEITDIDKRISGTRIYGELTTIHNKDGVLLFKVVKSLEDPNDVKLSVPFGTKYPVGEFYKRGKIVYRFKNGNYGVLTLKDIVLRLRGVEIKLIQTKPIEQKKPEITPQKTI